MLIVHLLLAELERLGYPFDKSLDTAALAALYAELTIGEHDAPAAPAAAPTAAGPAADSAGAPIGPTAAAPVGGY
jgi:hypothetical protein